MQNKVIKKSSPKVKIVFPNILLAFIPFSVLWILKITNCVNYSWTTVTSPLWIYALWCIVWLGIGIISYYFVRKMNS